MPHSVLRSPCVLRVTEFMESLEGVHRRERLHAVDRHQDAAASIGRRPNKGELRDE